ncbi:hypothetical protein CDAR_379201 [Caerostris darwini]|uniref:Secreted protein n=1 Tax=Caerostris darwini TaxID=1538125 RepID=A0AAV4R5Z5_9ARAC|nr:hypothetical protein CDAR_379201 [Caerostris darwini]
MKSQEVINASIPVLALFLGSFFCGRRRMEPAASGCPLQAINISCRQERFKAGVNCPRRICIAIRLIFDSPCQEGALPMLKTPRRANRRPITSTCKVATKSAGPMPSNWPHAVLHINWLQF